MPQRTSKKRKSTRKLNAFDRINEAKRSGYKALDLNGLKLKKVPPSVGGLVELKDLALSHNELTELPPAMARLTNLEELHLSFNKFSSLPRWIGSFKKLRHLCLNGNRCKRIPSAIWQLTKLTELQLASNGLEVLPDSISWLTELRSLFLVDNRLSELPESLRQLKRLQRLNLAGNPGLGIPEEILAEERTSYSLRRAENAKRILDYYFRVRLSMRPLNEAKLILVGRGGVGKTSLVNRLVHNAFSEGEKKTEGIKITQWSVMLNQSESARLNIWDFGGQEIMHATHQFFLTQRSLYLLVLNGREGSEDADAEYWLKLIESFGSESPIIVVLNKIKEHPFDLNRIGLKQKYPAIREFIATDCSDNTGFSALSQAIIRETDRLEHLRDGFPSSWLTIKDRLARMRKTFLSYDEYRNLCVKLGEKDNVSQDALGGYLHDLGIALNYKDDPRLQDTHVLNPHWVTNGIYKILNWDQLGVQKGEIRLSDLSRILDPTKYPTKMHRFLFDLMKKFELCFTFPDDDTHYLIPELLDKQEPESTAAFIRRKCLNFQYSYPVLPEGLLPRFIVRTHILSEGLARWRSGVILKFEGNQALIKADIQDRKVFISISGPSSGRRRLLAIIRSDFDRIHRDIRNLQPQEIVPLPEHPDTVIPYGDLLIMEKNGVKKFPTVVGEKVIDVTTSDLLNGIDIERSRRRDGKMDTESQAVRVFYSYSHNDEVLRNELETHLKLLQRQLLIEPWHDRKIEAGDEWKRKIDENLEEADIILLLISPDFISSDYCWEMEMKRALERHESGEARVVPIIIRDVNWRIAPFAKLQALPKDGKAVTTWANKDTAWRNVSDGIERIVTQIRAKRAS